MQQTLPRVLSGIAAALMAWTAWGQCHTCPSTTRDVRITRVLLNGSGETAICYAPGGTYAPFPTFFNYKITPHLTDEERDLKCDQTLEDPAPEVDDFEYNITYYVCEFQRGGGSPSYYTAESFESLLGIDFTRDGIVNEEDTLVLMQRLGLAD